jgi:hypothetical protein
MLISQTKSLWSFGDPVSFWNSSPSPPPPLHLTAGTGKEAWAWNWCNHCYSHNWPEYSHVASPDCKECWEQIWWIGSLSLTPVDWRSVFHLWIQGSMRKKIICFKMLPKWALLVPVRCPGWRLYLLREFRMSK